MSEQMNDAFGIPTESVVETPEQIEARLRAQAAAAVAKETEEAMLKRFVAEERAKTAPPPPDAQGFPPDYDKIEIQTGSQKTDLPYVPLGVNGYVIKAPRGEEIIVPHIFVSECLDHAIAEITVQGQGGLITRPARRFPYSFRGKATKEEYEAYMETQREKARLETRQAA